MKRLSSMVKGISITLDKIAGAFIFLVMLLVVSNVLLRAIFGNPIKGTYEVVGLLTAVAVGLGLSYCAYQNGHIAVSFIMDRLPKKVQGTIDCVTDFIAFGFWGVAVWYLIKYADTMRHNGLVTATSEIPIYPFVYVIAVGFFALCLIIVNKRLVIIKEAVRNLSKEGFFKQLESEPMGKEIV